MIEDELRREIVERQGTPEGTLLSESERNAIVQKERSRLKKHSRAINKARTKILRKKEATTLIQSVRREESHKEPEHASRAAPEKKLSPAKRGYHEIDVSY